MVYTVSPLLLRGAWALSDLGTDPPSECVMTEGQPGRTIAYSRHVGPLTKGILGPSFSLQGVATLATTFGRLRNVNVGSKTSRCPGIHAPGSRPPLPVTCRSSRWARLRTRGLPALAQLRTNPQKQLCPPINVPRKLDRPLRHLLV